MIQEEELYSGEERRESVMGESVLQKMEDNPHINQSEGSPLSTHSLADQSETRLSAAAAKPSGNQL